MRQVTAQDYRPGTVIGTPELLRDVLANEDGVFVLVASDRGGPLDRQQYLTRQYAEIDNRTFPWCWEKWLKAGRLRRAWLRTDCHAGEKP